MTVEADPAGTNKDITPNEQPFDRKKHWLDYVTLGLELFGLIVLCVYADYTIKIYHANQKAADAAQRTLGEVQKQTTLTRQQLVGTMSAAVTFQEPRITNDPITNKEIVVILILNQGHVIAPQAQATFKIDIVTFPNLNRLLESQTYTIVVPQLGPSGWSQRYPLRDFAPQERQFATQRKTITVKGTLGFDNGFGDKFEQPFCYSYVGSYNIKNEGGGSTSGGDGFMPCERFEELVPYILKHQLK